MPRPAARSSLKFAGAYHGHVDGLLAEAGSGLATQGIPASPGVPEGAAAQTIVVPFNDEAAVRAAVAEHELAAILVEPFAANMGLVAARRRASSSCCASWPTRAARCSIFDEVITGFRVGAGGAQDFTGVLPDLTIMGKVLGGGLPAAAYGGPLDLMRRIAPAGDVYQAGTLSGNPLAVAAGLTTLRSLDEAAYPRLTATTQALAEGLPEAAGERPVQVAWAPGLLTVFFSDEPVRDYAGAARLRPRGLRRVVPRHAGARRLPAAVPVRGLVPFARAHERARDRTLEAAAAAFAEIA